MFRYYDDFCVWTISFLDEFFISLYVNGLMWWCLVLHLNVEVKFIYVYIYICRVHRWINIWIVLLRGTISRFYWLSGLFIFLSSYCITWRVSEHVNNTVYWACHGPSMSHRLKWMVISWLTRNNLRFSQQKAVIFCDSFKRVLFGKDHLHHKRTKHIDIRYHFIWIEERIKAGGHKGELNWYVYEASS